MKLPEDFNYLKIDTRIWRDWSWVELSDADRWREIEKTIDGKPSLLSHLVTACRGRLPARDWQKVRHNVFARDGRLCRYCGTTTGPFQVDHITPLSRGGTNELDNLTVACEPCNRSKYNRTEREFMEMIEDD